MTSAVFCKRASRSPESQLCVEMLKAEVCELRRALADSNGCRWRVRRRISTHAGDQREFLPTTPRQKHVEATDQAPQFVAAVQFSRAYSGS